MAKPKVWSYVLYTTILILIDVLLEGVSYIVHKQNNFVPKVLLFRLNLHLFTHFHIFVYFGHLLLVICVR